MAAEVGIAHVLGGVATLLLVAYSIMLLWMARRYDRRGGRAGAADE